MVCPLSDTWDLFRAVNKDLRQPGLNLYPVNILLALFNAGKICDPLHVDEVVQPELHTVAESNDVIPTLAD